MKEVYSYQEVSTEIGQGEKVAFTAHPVLYVTAVRKSLESEAIAVTFEIGIGSYVIGEFTSEYKTFAALLDAFDIADHEEIFELLGSESTSAWDYAQSHTGEGVYKE